jgi:hypothetical protein
VAANTDENGSGLCYFVIGVFNTYYDDVVLNICYDDDTPSLYPIEQSLTLINCTFFEIARFPNDFSL